MEIITGSMERAQRAYTEEFYEVVGFSLEVAILSQEPLAWERTCNTVRPHQTLAYLTPRQFVTRWRARRGKTRCH